MLLKVFKGTGPGIVLLIIITLWLLWISAFLNPQPPDRLFTKQDPCLFIAFLNIWWEPPAGRRDLHFRVIDCFAVSNRLFQYICFFYKRKDLPSGSYLRTFQRCVSTDADFKSGITCSGLSDACPDKNNGSLQKARHCF